MNFTIYFVFLKQLKNWSILVCSYFLYCCVDNSGDCVENSISRSEKIVKIDILHKTNGKFIDDDSGTLFENLKVELYNICLANFVAQQAVPWECHRQLVRLIKTNIWNYDKMNHGKMLHIL